MSIDYNPAVLRALFFDLDNTLVDRDAAMRAWLGESLEPEQVERVMREDESGADPERLGHWLAMEYPCFDCDDVREGALGIFVAPYVRADDSTCVLLSRLARDFELVLVTNGGVGQREKLARSGLEPFFEHVLVSGEEGVGKPARELFERALARAGLGSSEVLFVGDDPHRDIAGAERVGMRTAWLRRGREFPSELTPPDHILERLEDLEAMVLEKHPSHAKVDVPA